MATGKRYYWIKLKDSFMSSDEIDYLMSQPDGANYVVLYQMLCLKTINTDGCLVSKIGEMLIPYDAEKIQRECKWFPLSTVRLALSVYKQMAQMPPLALCSIRRAARMISLKLTMAMTCRSKEV